MVFYLKISSCILIFHLFGHHFINGSGGDSSYEFQGCYHTCHFNNCTYGTPLEEFNSRQGTFEKLLLWSCDDECKYECMWHATNLFLYRGWNIPQFYGKWPFIRICGLQEPASVLFSLVNFLSHLYNLFLFRKTVPSNAPFYSVWHLYFLVCLNAWIWSMVFHARDTHLSERLDYFSAFSMVLSSFLIFLIRMSGKQRRARKTCFVIGTILFYAYHIWYLSSRRFDYAYNMKVNVSVGLLNGFGWLLWSWSRPDSRSYLFWCRVTVAIAASTMLLEVLDFPPLFWAFDAHSFWHLSTSILPFFWYRFIEGDCYHLLRKSDYSKHTKLKKSV